MQRGTYLAINAVGLSVRLYAPRLSLDASSYQLCEGKQWLTKVHILRWVNECLSKSRWGSVVFSISLPLSILCVMLLSELHSLPLGCKGGSHASWGLSSPWTRTTIYQKWYSCFLNLHKWIITLFLKQYCFKNHHFYTKLTKVRYS